MNHELMFAPAQLFAAVTVVTALLAPLPAAGVDAEAAERLARRENCLKCHGIDKKKDGPSYKQVAAKYRGKPGIEDVLIEHLSSGGKVSFPDGHEEEHKILKVEDPQQMRNLVQWILSL